MLLLPNDDEKNKAHNKKVLGNFYKTLLCEQKKIELLSN
jgi:hypothetical protein